MSDDARLFGAELSTMIADLRAHAQRRVAIFDNMQRFLDWVAANDAEVERMAGQFMPLPPPPQSQDHQHGFGHDADHLRRLDEALSRQDR